MQIGIIQPNDELVCCHCHHERIVSSAWLEEVCREHFPNRTQKFLYDSDLGRFRCSKCRTKKLLRRANSTAIIFKQELTEPVQGRQFVTSYLDQASPNEIASLQYWAFQLVALRESNLAPLDKAKRAIQLTIESGAILPFITFIGSEIKRIGWDERGLPERIALSAAATAALLFSGQGAGIAALGGAIGVPLWVVFGAGGAFAGLILEEANRRTDKDNSDTPDK